MLNASDEVRETTLDRAQFQNHFATWKSNYLIRDVWAAEEIGTTDQHPEVSRELAPHAVMLFRLELLSDTK